MVERKFYYHITQKKWPKRITLIPRKTGEHRAIDEPEINRICVSPSIEQCIVALGSCLRYYSNINIYRTVSKVYACESYNIADSHITNETWLVNPTRFMKVGTINYLIPESIFSLCVGNSSGFKKQIENLKKLQDMKLKFVTKIK